MDSAGRASDSTSGISTPNRRRRPGGSRKIHGKPAKRRSDDRARTAADYRVSRTGSSAVPGAGSDRRGRRDLEHLLLFLIKSHLTGTPVAISTLASVAKVPHATAMRRIHALIERGDIVQEPLGERQQKVQAAAQRGIARKLCSIRAQDQIPARRDLRPAVEDRQRRGFLFWRVLFRGADHSAAAADREPVPRQARDQVPAQRRQLFPVHAEHVGGFPQQHGLAQELRFAQTAPVARAAHRKRRATQFPNTISSRSMRPGSARR